MVVRWSVATAAPGQADRRAAANSRLLTHIHAKVQRTQPSLSTDFSFAAVYLLRHSCKPVFSLSPSAALTFFSPANTSNNLLQ